MKRRTALLIGAPVLIIALAAAGTWQLSRSRSWQFFDNIVPRVETSQRVVALTFDDGPTSRGVQKLLPILRKRGVKATFFVIGSELEKAPELGRQIVEEGHELGNHSYTHQRMIFCSREFIEQEIERTDQLIRNAGFSGPIPFRPPYGKKLFELPRYLHEHGRRVTVTWDIEPESYPEIAADTHKIVAHVLEHAQPGSIILLHPMYRSGDHAIDAVPAIIEGLQQRGYRFVGISQLLSLRSDSRARRLPGSGSG